METTGAAAKAAALVDGDQLWRDLQRMGEVGGTANGGVNRPALSQADIAARKLLASWGAEIGLEVMVDDIANLFLRLPWSEQGLAPVLMGSHLDSQPTGGRFDGTYGVLAGLAALRAFSRAGFRPRRSIEVACWTNEEGSRFAPGCMGSAVYCGQSRPEDFQTSVDREGIRFQDALSAAMQELGDLARYNRSQAPAAYVEAHIEQGPELESTNTQIGIVVGSYGTKWFELEVEGQEGHAGTTPMHLRRDALVAAHRIISDLRAWALRQSNARITVGRMDVHPGSPNTIPGRVRFTIDLRHPDAAFLDEAAAMVRQIASQSRSGETVSCRQILEIAPAAFSASVVDVLDRGAAELGQSRMRMLSGAFHDAVNLSGFCPTGMIFIPCRAGLSHNEAEYASPQHAAAGATLLTWAVANLAIQ